MAGVKLAADTVHAFRLYTTVWSSLLAVSSKYTFKIFSFLVLKTMGREAPFKMDFNKAIMLTMSLSEHKQCTDLPSDTSLKSTIRNCSVAKFESQRI